MKVTLLPYTLNPKPLTLNQSRMQMKVSLLPVSLFYACCT